MRAPPIVFDAGAFAEYIIGSPSATVVFFKPWAFSRTAPLLSLIMIFCITGIDQAENLHVLASLEHAVPSMDTVACARMKTWHAQATSIGALFNANEARMFSMLDRLTYDCIVSQETPPSWCWADARSVPYLDYWRHSGLPIKFILVALPLEEYVARQLDDDDLAPDAIIERWLEVHRKLLRFHLAAPELSYLIFGGDQFCATELTVALSDQFNSCAGEPFSKLATPRGEICALTRYLTTALIQAKPEARNLSAELNTIAIGARPNHNESCDSSVLIEAISNLRRYAGAAQALDACRAASKADLDELGAAHEAAESLVLRLRETQSRLADADASLGWARALATPYVACDIDRLEYVQKDEATLVWRLPELHLAHYVLRELTFCTTQSGDYVRLCLNVPAELSRVLRQNDTQNAPVCYPQTESAQPENGSRCVWELIGALIHIVQTRLTSPATAVLPMVWRTGLLRTAEMYKQEAPALRFDNVIVDEHLSWDGYESIRVTLDRAGFGERNCDRFRFRLATANPPGVAFGMHPRLEFESESCVLLSSWYAETTDGRNRRLELRFAQPGAMDLDVWAKIAPFDGELVKALILTLPRMLVMSERSMQCEHDKKWQKMAEAMATILRKVVA